MIISGEPSLVWVWKLSPKNPKIFHFLPFGSKKFPWIGSKSTQVKAGLAPYFPWVKSMLGSGQGPSLMIMLHRKSLILSKYKIYFHTQQKVCHGKILLAGPNFFFTISFLFKPTL